MMSSLMMQIKITGLMERPTFAAALVVRGALSCPVHLPRGHEWEQAHGSAKDRASRPDGGTIALVCRLAATRASALGDAPIVRLGRPVIPRPRGARRLRPAGREDDPQRRQSGGAMRSREGVKHSSVWPARRARSRAEGPPRIGRGDDG